MVEEFTQTWPGPPPVAADVGRAIDDGADATLGAEVFTEDVVVAAEEGAGVPAGVAVAAGETAPNA